jgi:hypothetical protein
MGPASSGWMRPGRRFRRFAIFVAQAARTLSRGRVGDGDVTQSEAAARRSSGAVLFSESESAAVSVSPPSGLI